MATPQKTSLTTLAIRRHIGTLMLAIALIVVGVYSLFQMPVDLLPAISYPRIGVRADAPGVVPEVLVNEVTRPLEEALAATEGVTQIFSQTREGRISIDMFFDAGADVDQSLNDATATLNRARSSLPESVDQPRLFRFDPSQLPIYEMALTSSVLQPVDLRVFADEELARELIRVPGVANVDVSGGVEEEVQVNLDLKRLQALGLNISDVLQALGDRNQDTSGGLLRGGDTEVLTRVMGQFQDADEIRNLPIQVGSNENPQTIKLQDVADINDGIAEQRLTVTLNGQPAVKMTVQKQPDANTIRVIDGVKAKLEELQQSGVLSDDLEMTATLDESKFIRSSIRNVAIAGLTGATLAAIAVLLFLGSLRQTLIIVLAIPLATLTAISLMRVFNLSLNVFSLGGLALGVGIVVDNSIVMLENIAKGVQGQSGARGKLRRTVESSSQSLESALLASTTTNLVSVLPFLLVGGFLALIFSELILTISFAVAASLAIALTIVPSLSARLLTRNTTSSLQSTLPIRLFASGLAAVTERYKKILSWVLDRRIFVLIAAIAIFGGSSFWMVGQLPQEILPRINTGLAGLFVRFPVGTTVEENRTVMAAVDEVLLAQPETEYVFTTSGGALFSNITVNNALRGSSTITLKPGTDVDSYVSRVNGELRKNVRAIGTSIFMRPGTVRGLFFGNALTRDDIDLVLQGPDTKSLDRAGEILLAALEEKATSATYEPDATPPQPEVQIQPDWQRATALGLTATEIGDTIQTALDGSVQTQLQRGDRLIDIRVQLKPQTIQQASQLRTIPLFTDSQKLVNLGDLATVQTGDAPGEIQRINQRQILLIEGSLTEGATLSEALTELDEIYAELDLPEGVSRRPSAAGETNQQIQTALKVLGIMAAFLVFVVMAVQYNSLIDPLVIMLTVPMALAGGIFGLFMTETAIGAMVIVGAVLLIGIVVNNAIILVELANQIRQGDHLSYRAAMLEAAPQRLRPILMTTITTVLGLFPLALGIGEGSEFLQPLGIVVFSGLSFATVLTLFIIPCFYTLLHDLSGPRKGKPRRAIAKSKDVPMKV
ncbi:acriflavin resistance protein [[Leptolyngbya] sp. PCC 7376]|uniref:efflux RND transporter permease subunit n=1 Tax=[Leptolyngbya] sp. PCC 7376 TaxID=111781 RepID=UPI00029EC69D|nr:efflux RND transporter permease subunit [[Leptolyngbya] sp. PCC 7376]AFY39266.1 acriflavin resistance protein [[Leptolyngbya] sp. PCC 7376]